MNVRQNKRIQRCAIVTNGRFSIYFKISFFEVLILFYLTQFKTRSCKQYRVLCTCSQPASPNENIFHNYSTLSKPEIDIDRILLTNNLNWISLFCYPVFGVGIQCLVLCNFITCLDMCNHHHNQDTCYYFKTFMKAQLGTRHCQAILHNNLMT